MDQTDKLVIASIILMTPLAIMAVSNFEKFIKLLLVSGVVGGAIYILFQAILNNK